MTAQLADEKEQRLSMSKAQLHQAQANLELVRSSAQKERIAAARAALAAAEAQRDLIKFRLDNTDIRAPIAGTVVVKNVQVGETVRPDALVNGRSLSVCEIADLTQLDVVVNLAEGDLPKVSQGAKCEVRPGAVQDAVLKGQVSRVMPVISPETRTAAARIRMEMPSDSSMLRPGMHANVRFLPKD